MKKRSLQIVILFIFWVLLLNLKSYAGTQKWNSLNYDVTLNEDGSMDVIETWNIKISETNTVFKDFKIDRKKYSDITNINVSKIENGEEIYLTQIYQEQYHVDSGCFYALPIDFSTFEIAWNVGLDNSTATRTYKLYYTIEDAVKVYNDCSELYWQFLGTENNISGKNVTGTIKLPSKVSNIEKLRVWAHGDLSGNIERTDTDLVTFSINNLNENTMLEVRVVVEDNIFYSNNSNYQNKLSSILEEEQAWADQANAQRKIMRGIIAGVIGINILILVFTFFRVRKIHKKGKELEANYGYPQMDLEYYREIPDEENATPARASYLYSAQKTNWPNNIDLPKVFAGTILDLSLKGLVLFEQLDEKEVKIMINQNKYETVLPEDEKIVYDILKSAIGNKEFITTKAFKKYAKVNYESMYTKLGKIQKYVEEHEELLGNIDEERKKVRSKLNIKETIYTILLICSIIVLPIGMFLPTIYIMLIALMVATYKNMKKVGKLSDKGFYEKNEWCALKKYMEDYSLLKEKTVPDIILWEKFLVYATTFGISKKVIEQLKLVHPEMFVDNNNDFFTRYTYWHIVSNSYGIDSFSNFSSGLEKVYTNASSAYSAAHSSSSGSGGGGGFSGGGGGRRRWRRLRRSLILPIKYSQILLKKVDFLIKI